MLALAGSLEGWATVGAYHSGLTGVRSSHRFDRMQLRGVLFIAVFAAATPAYADLAAGRDKLTAGDYKGAIAVL